MLNITYQLNTHARTAPFKPREALPFGQMRSDHMFLMDWDGEITPDEPQGEWHSERIVPYGPLQLNPGSIVLNYAQGCFEGAKIFEHPDGKLYMFRPEMNAERLNRSASALILPQIPIEDQLQALVELAKLERLNYPQQEGACFYVRPLLFGTQDSLGVYPSRQATYCLFLSPSGPYFKGGARTIDLLISEEFNRVAPGGLGSTKAIANYAGSIRVAHHASRYNAKQVLYTGVHGKRIEEAGAMNHFHVTADGEIIIPSFTDTILKSITSQSILELSELKILKQPVRQEPVYLNEFIRGLTKGRITEAGGLGTAAGVAPVGRYWRVDHTTGTYFPITVGNGEVGPVATEMYRILTGIQRGTITAPEGWLVPVDR